MTYTVSSGTLNPSIPYHTRRECVELTFCVLITLADLLMKKLTDKLAPCRPTEIFVRDNHNGLSADVLFVRPTCQSNIVVDE